MFIMPAIINTAPLDTILYALYTPMADFRWTLPTWFFYFVISIALPGLCIRYHSRRIALPNMPVSIVPFFY